MKYLADEREAARGPQVALDDLYVIVFGKELYVERSRDVQCGGYFARNLFDAAHGLHIKFLRGELYGGITRVHAGKFYVLADCV